MGGLHCAETVVSTAGTASHYFPSRNSEENCKESGHRSTVFVASRHLFLVLGNPFSVSVQTEKTILTHFNKGSHICDEKGGFVANGLFSFCEQQCGTYS